FSFKMSLDDAMAAGLIPTTRQGGIARYSVDFSDTYRYSNAEAILVCKENQMGEYTLIHFKYGNISVDSGGDNSLRSSEARRVAVSLIQDG
ncbi:hypothetical protein ACFL3F_04855, partial [Planctomycetota bacterium]